MEYTIVFSERTYKKVQRYKKELKEKQVKPGRYLGEFLKADDIRQVSDLQLLQYLINTKKPCIFAESQISGEGIDWNYDELSIMGDISFAVPVTVYDNGLHSNPEVYSYPYKGTLLYTPGALIRNDKGFLTPDFREIVKSGGINPDSYYSLYERRLLPLFYYANKKSKELNTTAFITIPGLGCGQFAGPYRGELGSLLEQVIGKLLNTYASDFPYLSAVYFDPYRECENRTEKVKHINFYTRPLTKGNEQNGQLTQPGKLIPGRGYERCHLFSFVAWDHVSWPGNDFYSGVRSTDDGVKAAATDSMFRITGIQGQYDSLNNQYDPPEGYSSWRQVIRKNNLKLEIKGNLMVVGEVSSR